MAAIDAYNLLSRLDPPKGLAENPAMLQTWLNQVYDVFSEKAEWAQSDQNVSLTAGVEGAVIDLDIGRVYEGDVFLVTFYYSITKGGTAGDTKISMSHGGVGATVIWDGASLTTGEPAGIYQDHLNQAAGSTQRSTMTGIARVINAPKGDKTLSIQIGITSDGSVGNNDVNCYVFRLHRGARRE